MRLCWHWFCVMGIFCLVSASLPAGEQKETKSALETDAKGWMDLLAKGDLSEWKRVAIPPGGKPGAKNPWSYDAETKMLLCDGVGIHEMLLFNKEFDDGIFHVEWRFKKIEGKSGYNSGVYVRNSAYGDIWHQAQVGSKNVGYIFGQTMIDGKKAGVPKNTLKGPQRGKEAGEWNTYEITCQGKTMTLWVNGYVTAAWDGCEVPSGYLALEAEGYYIEFKNLKYKPLKKES